MKDTYSVSVIVPVFNAEKYIRRCVFSLFGQSLKNMQYVFVDDCSTDQSREILKKLIEEFPNRKDDVIIVHHSCNQGQAAARKSGLERASGEYIGWVDADDYAENSMFQEMYETAKKQNADIVCCDIVREKKEGLVEECFSYEIESKENVMDHIEGGVYSALWNKIVRRSMYVDYSISFVDGVNMWDDLSVTLPLRYLSHKTIIIHKPFYVYNNINPSSITISNQSYKHRMQMLRCAEHLIAYFKNLMPRKHYNKLLLFGFETKKFLFYPPYYDLMLWRTIIPESNGILFNCPMPILNKIYFYLIQKLPIVIADTVMRRHYHLS